MQESNRLLESRTLGKNILREYDIDDDNKATVEQELSSIASDIQDVNPDLDFSSVDAAQMSLDNSNVCMIGDDVNGFVNRNFGQKIKEMFPDKVQEVTKTISDYLTKFIDYLSNLDLSELKSLLKSVKNKINEIKNNVVSEEILKEFFGTSMAIITIGSFSMPALVLTIASVAIVTLVGIWLLRSILCAFNINITTKKRCRVRSFSWGQCN
jgi:membrane-associated HD superfamily phosphohydrolase